MSKEPENKRKNYREMYTLGALQKQVAKLERQEAYSTGYREGFVQGITTTIELFALIIALVGLLRVFFLKTLRQQNEYVQNGVEVSHIVLT